MGNTAGKTSREGGDDVVTSFQHLSNHDGKLTEREATSAWYRYGVSVTDVYDVVEVLGQGHMGETFTVRRKTTGHHTAHTREQSKGSENDLLRMAKEREEKENPFDNYSSYYEDRDCLIDHCEKATERPLDLSFKDVQVL
jgi:hypothetical protein